MDWKDEIQQEAFSDKDQDGMKEETPTEAAPAESGPEVEDHSDAQNAAAEEAAAIEESAQAVLEPVSPAEPLQKAEAQSETAASAETQKETRQQESVPAGPVTPDPRMYGWQIPPQNVQQPYGNPQQSYQPPYQPPQQPYRAYTGPGYGYPYQQPYAGGSYRYRPPQGYGAPVTPAPVYYQRPNQKMSGGLKAFFIVMGSLIGALLIALVVFCFVEKPRIEVPTYQVPEFFSSGEDPEELPSLPEEEDTQEEEEQELPAYTIIPNTDGITLQPLPTGAELSAKEIYATISQSVVGITATRSDVEGESEGSGIIATADGYVVTNSHVVLNSRSTRIKVTLNDKKEYTGVVIGCDKTTDLAVIKIVDTTDTFIPATFGDSDTLSVGDWVLAIGNPGGSEYAGSLTRGIVSAVNRKVGSNSENGMTYIQTDAAINPGNSGGALVNMYGQVIGINSAKIVANGYEGMGFSIPVSKAKAIIDELMATGFVEGRTRLGIMGQEVSAYTAWAQNVPLGFQIYSINEESSFTGTDVQPGDIITAINGVTVTSLKDISNELSIFKPGDSVSVSIYRPASNTSEGKTFDVEIILLEDKGETQQ